MQAFGFMNFVLFNFVSLGAENENQGLASAKQVLFH